MPGKKWHMAWVSVLHHTAGKRLRKYCVWKTDKIQAFTDKKISWRNAVCLFCFLLFVFLNQDKGKKPQARGMPGEKP